MAHAIARGYVAPVDSAALACLPALSGVEAEPLWRAVVGRGLPLPLAIHTTPAGRIALIVLPLSVAEVYTERARLRQLIARSLEQAECMGARVVSLTGLIPSATALAGDVLPDRADGLPRLTTGHATTVSAVVLMLADGLERAQLDLSQEALAIVGMGSIGSATLELALQTLSAPARLLLCDIYQSRQRLESIAARIRARLGIPVELSLAEGASVPDEVYEARVLVGATNVPNVLDVRRLRPGTVLIDDSAPHCFDVEQARLRGEREGDLLICEGGVVRCPQPLTHRLFLPTSARSASPKLTGGALGKQAFSPTQIMGCVRSAALSAGPQALPCTVGPVALTDALSHYRALRSLGFRAPPPQVDGWAPRGTAAPR